MEKPAMPYQKTPHLSRKPRIQIVFPMLAPCLLAATLASAAGPVVNSSLRAQTDKLESFYAAGELTTAVEVNSGKMTGPLFSIPPGATEPCWKIRVGHDAADITQTEAKGVQIKIEGEHICFHTEENTPNNLPLIHSTPAVDIANGNNKSLSVWGGVSHPGRGHFDYYAISQWAGVKVLGKTLNLGLEHAVVDALHQYEDPGWEKTGETVGAAAAKGSTLAFSAEKGILRLLLPAINILDSIGGETGGIAPDFSGDPLQRAVMVISEIPIRPEPDPEGWWFGENGSVSLLDPEGVFALEAMFQQLRIRRTDQGADGSFTEGTARLHEGTIVFSSQGNDGETMEGTFLDRFVQNNLLGSDRENRSEYSIGLAFRTDQDLIKLTEEFTTDAAEIPCDVFLCLLRNQEPQHDREGVKIQEMAISQEGVASLRWIGSPPVMVEFAPWSEEGKAGWVEWKELDGPVEGGQWTGNLPPEQNAGLLRLRPTGQ
jgi:hypothetical protein